MKKAAHLGGLFLFGLAMRWSVVLAYQATALRITFL
jgi:hypothetical protein